MPNCSPQSISSLVALFQKECRVGAPLSINHEAGIRALLARFVEGIPTIKALVKRLKEDVAFKLSLGFLYSQRVPSQATFSRMIQTLGQQPEVLEHLNECLLQEIDQTFAIFEEPIALDATAIQAHSKPKKTTNPKLPSTQDQRQLSTEELLEQCPIFPSWE